MPVQEPPPLIQEPEGTKKTVVIQQPRVAAPSFDFTKVLAAVGLILVGTIIIIAAMWIWIQSLESRVKNLEEEISTSKVTTSSAKPVSSSATPSAGN
jgi:hypothetical protein